MKLGFYSIWHILIIVVLIGLMVLGLYLIKKKVHTEKELHKVLVVLSILTLITWVLCRFSHISHSIEEGTMLEVFGELKPYNWFMLVPNTFCSFIGLVTPFVILFNKYKNSKYMDSIYSMAILGLLTNIFYPEYMGRLPFLEFRVNCAILYHVLCGFIFLVLLSKKVLKPRLKTWYYTPIAMSLMMTLGIIELVYFNFNEAFNITKPLVEGLYITTFGFLCIGYILCDLLFRFILEKVQK